MLLAMCEQKLATLLYPVVNCSLVFKVFQITPELASIRYVDADKRNVDFRCTCFVFILLVTFTISLSLMLFDAASWSWS